MKDTVGPLLIFEKDITVLGTDSDLALSKSVTNSVRIDEICDVYAIKEILITLYQERAELREVDVRGLAVTADAITNTPTPPAVCICIVVTATSLVRPLDATYRPALSPRGEVLGIVYQEH
ncbi:hypothetical protein EVAR_43126_1 [Eumeta japonica]|uniref:Uncharacterized protein n=1 Tax=Eumeta variegata TaxID=151549 RepID=A0A4C1XS55_EUMVA|nr:hypothetical protein EVAR_43126_1 [Eumeta japonica]